jgi:hypothetical protein
LDRLGASQETGFIHERCTPWPRCLGVRRWSGSGEEKQRRRGWPASYPQLCGRGACHGHLVKASCLAASLRAR